MKMEYEVGGFRPRGFTRRKVMEWMGVSSGSLIAATLTNSAQQASTLPRSHKGRLVKIDAKPSAISIDLANTAVIVIDMQNDFGSKGGMFDRFGIDNTMIQQAVPPTARVIAAARNIGIKIVYLKMAFRPDLSDVGPPDSPNGIAHRQVGVGTAMLAPNGTQGRILIRDTWNTEVVSDLKPENADIQIYKHRYSGFFQTDLDATLKQFGIRHLIVTGCTTSVCVESTIRDAMFRDYSAILLADCTGEPLGNRLQRSNHDASLFLIAERNLGWVSSSEKFLQATDLGQASSSSEFLEGT